MGLGLLIRLKVMETEAFQVVQQTRHTKHVPALAAMREHPRSVVVSFGARIAENGGSYVFLVFVLAYATQIGVSQTVALTAVVLAMALESIAMPLWGALSDRVGRRPVYLGGAIAMVLWAAPFFILMNTTETAQVIVAVVVANMVCHGAMIGTQPAFFSELFASEVRYSGVALGHELASVLAGGLSPLIATSLLAWAGSWWPVSVYLAVLGLVTIIAVAWSRETAASDLSSVPGRAGPRAAAVPTGEVARR
jgi:MFS transporter, MHS family, shikimate and dehydroshikimate transport protein